MLGEPGKIRRGASFFFGEQPVEGERFFVRMSSHDPDSDNENKAAIWEGELHCGEDGEESRLKGHGGYPARPHVLITFLLKKYVSCNVWTTLINVLAI